MGDYDGVVSRGMQACDVNAHQFSAQDQAWALRSPNCEGFLRSHVRICLAWMHCFLELAKTLLLVMIPIFKLRDKYFFSQFCGVACRSTLTCSSKLKG